MEKQYYIYILKSKKDNKNYIGYTKRFKQRLYEHTNGNVKSTRNRRPLKLIYKEMFINKEEAQKREKFLKSGKGQEEIKKLLKNKAPWPSG